MGGGIHIESDCPGGISVRFSSLSASPVPRTSSPNRFSEDFSHHDNRFFDGFASFCRALRTSPPGTFRGRPDDPFPCLVPRTRAVVSARPPPIVRKIRLACPFPSLDGSTAAPPDASPLVGHIAPSRLRALGPRIRALRSVARCGGPGFWGGNQGKKCFCPPHPPCFLHARAMRRRGAATAHGFVHRPCSAHEFGSF